MPILPTQAQREVSVKSALGADVLLFKRMACSEALGRLSEFRVEMASSRSDIKIAEILGTELTVALDLPGGDQRWFHGIVTHFSYHGWRDGMAPPSLEFATGANGSALVPIRPGRCRWTRLVLSDGSAARLVETL